MSQVFFPGITVIGALPEADQSLPQICKAKNCTQTALRGEPYCGECLQRAGLKPGDFLRVRREQKAWLGEKGLSRRGQGKLARRIMGYAMGCCKIYFIRMGKDGPIKIGKTNGHPWARLAELQTGNPYKLELVAYISAPDQIEEQLHAYFDEYRMEGEWFQPVPEVLEFAALVSESRLDDILERFERRIAENKP